MTDPVRNRYLADTVSTSSPARLIVMLYDALVRDLTLAETHLRAQRADDAHDRLLHAQDIVLELRSSLRPDLWDGADALAAVYSYLLTQLVQANVRKDPETVALCRGLVEPLRDAWSDAATTLTQEGEEAPAIR